MVRLLAPALAVCLAACHPTSPTQPQTASIRIASPDSGISVRGVVQVQVTTEGEVPDRIELLISNADAGVDAGVLTSPTSPATFAVNTDALTEGPHDLTAQAWKDEINWVSQPPTTLIVDRTPPKLFSQSPSEGASNWPVSASAQLVFTEPMDPGSFTQDAFALTANTVNGVIPVAFLFSNGDQTVQIKPVAPVPLDARFALGVDGTRLTDLAGNALGGSILPSGYFWYSPAWLSLKFQIDTPGGPEYAVALSNGASTPYLVIEAEGGVTAGQQSGATWSDLPNDLLPGTTHGVIEGAAVTATNDLWVITDGASGMALAHWDQTRWDFPALPSALVALGQTNVGMAVDSHGNLALGFTDDTSHPAHVQRFLNGQWQALSDIPELDNPRSVNEGHLSGTNPQIVFDGNDRLVVAGTGTDDAIWSYRWDDSAGWQTLSPLKLGIGNFPVLVSLISGGGQLHALFLNNGGDFYVAELSDITWQMLSSSPLASFTSLSDSSGNNYPQQLLFTAQGLAVALQGTVGTSSTSSVLLERYRGGSWQLLPNSLTAEADTHFTSDTTGRLIKVAGGGIDSAIYNE